MTKPVWKRQADIRALVRETAAQVYGPHWIGPASVAMGIGRRHLHFCLEGSRYFLREHVEALFMAARDRRSEVDAAASTLAKFLAD